MACTGDNCLKVGMICSIFSYFFLRIEYLLQSQWAYRTKTEVRYKLLLEFLAISLKLGNNIELIIL